MFRLIAKVRDVLFDPLALTELFLIGNVAFLAVDVYVAHDVNDFANRGEWIPVIFSPVATVLLIVGVVVAGGICPPLSPWRTRENESTGLREWTAWTLGVVVGAAAIAMGVGGLLYHLESGFFQHQTL